MESVRNLGFQAIRFERPHSDIDLELWGKIESRLLSKILLELDELSLPYQFSFLVVYNKIKNEDWIINSLKAEL